MPWVKLNAFQQVMRLWDQVHPYNAAQAFRMEGRPDPDQINHAWSAARAAIGVGRVIVRGLEFRHQVCSNHSHSPVRRGEDLESLISEELNRPFQSDEDCPLRPFLIPESGAFTLGVIYQHWFADSAAIRALLHEWLLRLLGNPGRRAPMRLPEGGFWRYFGPGAGRWTIDDGILSLLRYRTRFCRARLAAGIMGDCRVRFTLHPLPDGLPDTLRAIARHSGATVNDLLLAVAAEAVHHHGVNPPSRGRDELALGTIVDLRPSAAEEMSDIFGMFLGFTTTMVRPLDLRCWPRLLATISRQNAWQKRTAAAQSSVLRLAAGLAEARFTTPQRWVAAYRRRMPIAAGISNVNMNRTWAAEFHPDPLLDYIRVAPTGPMIPMVFSLTTIGRKLNLGFTRMAALVDDDRAARIIRHVTGRLADLADGGPAT